MTCLTTLFPHPLRGLLLVTPFLLSTGLANLTLFLLPFAKLLLPSSLIHTLCSLIAGTLVYRFIQHIFTAINSAEITFSGDTPLPNESAIVISNHVAWSDFYLVQAAADKANMGGHTRYFAKAGLKWGLWGMGMPTVTREWTRDKRELERVFRGVKEEGWKTWLVSFSEGSRFTPEKYLQSRLWCRQNSKPQPEYLLYPRTRGFIATVQHLRKAPHVKAVYDLTLAYQCGEEFQKAPTMWETIAVPKLSLTREQGGVGYRFHVHVRRFPIEELPGDAAGLAKWLEQRWVEKGRWLEARRLRWASVDVLRKTDGIFGGMGRVVDEDSRT
ncbi:uncharacterized protein QC761_117905 [Podospora bellae-mahoneyi]|uniref:Phospholipid/glycerol acyltransferase domain-containing protein n=1 Tax=Podospora bellae-mahoneyi TaxID=2093777 RepID=A0ABR0G0W6_9PEZI|nr:hypothetical protein QC761_117905 [Podospora bellae-mahoneyi]